MTDYIPDFLTIEEEDDIVVCKFCGKTNCNCCPNCGSQLDKTSTELVCDICGWVQ